jgi:hypothetical protein
MIEVEMSSHNQLSRYPEKRKGAFRQDRYNSAAMDRNRFCGSKTVIFESKLPNSDGWMLFG